MPPRADPTPSTWPPDKPAGRELLLAVAACSSPAARTASRHVAAAHEDLSPLPGPHPIRRAARGRYVPVLSGRLLAHTRNERGQVEPVRRTVASLVVLDASRTSLEESGSSDAVAAGTMRQADTDLRQTLPQTRFFVRSSLPAGLQHLVRGERPAFLHQPPGDVQSLQRWQRLFRNRFNASCPIRQGAAQGIARASLPWPTSIVAVSASVSVAGHRGHRSTRSCTPTVVIRPS